MMKDTNVVVNLPKKSDDHPVAMLVQIASRYESRIYMADGPRKVNAKSIMGMMALGVNNGQEIVISAEVQMRMQLLRLSHITSRVRQFNKHK
jgi:catabolite repression HPr-like protein